MLKILIQQDQNYEPPKPVKLFNPYCFYYARILVSFCRKIILETRETRETNIEVFKNINTRDVLQFWYIRPEH